MCGALHGGTFSLLVAVNIFTFFIKKTRGFVDIFTRVLGGNKI